MGQEAETRADGSFNVSVTYQLGFWCPQTGSRPASVSLKSSYSQNVGPGGRSFVPVGAVQQQCERNQSLL